MAASLAKAGPRRRGIGENHAMNTNPTTPAADSGQEVVAHLGKSDLNLVWIDCEMTGLDPERDRLLEIAVVITGPQLARASRAPCWRSTRAMPRSTRWTPGTVAPTAGAA